MKIYGLVFGVLTALLPFDGSADGGRLTLEACLDSAVSRNPALNSAALEVRKANVMKGTAFNPDKTGVTLKQETTGGGGPENAVFFSQDFEFPTVYVARHRTLSAEAELAAMRFDLLLGDVRKEVEEAFYGVAYYNELLSQRRSLQSIYDEFCRVAEVRWKEGDAGMLELMNAERVRELNDMEIEQLKLGYESRLAELRRVTGCNDIEGIEADTFGAIGTQDIIIGGETASPLRSAVARQETEVARRQLALARNELLPEFSLGASVQAVIKSFNPYHVDRQRFTGGNFMGFEVGLSMPLFFGSGKAKIKAAEIDRNISLLNEEATEASAMTELRNLTSRLESLDGRLRHYREKAVPRADEIKRIATVSYELGEIDYMEYITNIETAFSVYRDYADCINEHNITAINLKALCLQARQN